ncbi:MAG: putative sigma regulatory protein MucB/RseB [Frankiales bacterium]|nr:putative sigma regulatory protein MucB/RseB [Frankiales bacterium]
MTRRRLLVVAVGAGVVLAGLPALATVDAGSAGAESSEAHALALLERAAQAGRRLSYTGTQYVASWRQDSSESALVELSHDPSTGSVVRSGEPVSAIATLDPRMLARLSVSYALAVKGPGRCTGRAASIVEARRDDGRVAGRFWVDRETGMLLRREVFDQDGERVRSSAFVDLDVRPAAAAAPVPAMAVRTGGERPSEAAVERLRADGWLVPQVLPDRFRLFQTRRNGDVLHLAYTDGLSTLSLFAQEGELGSEPMEGFGTEHVDGRPVWVRRAAPERVVWAGAGRVWTLVSDAPEDAVLAAVAALPRDAAPDDGLRSRLSRGLGRLGGMLNPFG